MKEAVERQKVVEAHIAQYGIFIDWVLQRDPDSFSKKLRTQICTNMNFALSK